MELQRPTSEAEIEKSEYVAILRSSVRVFFKDISTKCKQKGYNSQSIISFRFAKQEKEKYQ